MKLPGKIFVRWEIPSRDVGAPWLQANTRLADVMDDDGPHDVGIYGLLKVERVEKVITVKTKRIRT